MKRVTLLLGVLLVAFSAEGITDRLSSTERLSSSTGVAVSEANETTSESVSSGSGSYFIASSSSGAYESSVAGSSTGQLGQSEEALLGNQPGRCTSDCHNRGFCLQHFDEGICECKSNAFGEICQQVECGGCNGRGACVDGLCHCEPGWTGVDCAYRGCQDNCNNNGYCHIGQDFVECRCFAGYSGDFCSIAPDMSGCPNNCTDHGICVDNQCYCRQGFTGEACAQHACPDNCNERGVCNVDIGVCTCMSPHFGTGCELTPCQSNCNNHGTCDFSTGDCVCDQGFWGADCSPANCDQDCNGDHGTCIPPHESADNRAYCDCTSEWEGEACEIRVCPEGYSGPTCEDRSCHLNCSYHGNCTADYTCDCFDGWRGDYCEEKRCPNDCSGTGTCQDGACLCHGEWTGEDCSIPPIQCPNDCSSNGICSKGLCFCYADWTGNDCSTPVPETPETPDSGTGVSEPPSDDDNGGGWIIATDCVPMCTEHGRCVQLSGLPSQCYCEEGWTGMQCELPSEQ